MTTNSLSNYANMQVLPTSSAFLHPTYSLWQEEWVKIRDTEMGEAQIKRKRGTYLPKQANQTEESYNAYLFRAVFFNMVSKTLNALYGTAFLRKPKVSFLPREMEESTAKITKDALSLNLLAKTAVKELLAMGRYGMLVDMDPSGNGDPYIATYTAENILDWETAEVNGVDTLIRVILKETYYERESFQVVGSHKTKYRVLMLHYDQDTEQNYYEQRVYTDIDEIITPDLNTVEPSSITIPTIRGEALDHIPFIVLGPFTNSPDIQKPPLLDIVTLNLSHYNSYAQLEQGRYYTGLPMYYAQVSSTSQEAAEYIIAPDTVWVLGTGEKAGILEFNGHGLRGIENALTTKEQQIAAIGGRMMPGTSKGASESDNSLLMQERNEQTLLLNIADTTDEGFTTILRWFANWKNVAPANIKKLTFELNRDYLVKPTGAREFRAIHSMYNDGVIPIDVFYDYLRRADVIPDWVSSEEFSKMLSDPDQFPSMPDALARMNNFPDAQSFIDDKRAKEEFKLQQAALDQQAEDNIKNSTSTNTGEDATNG